MSLLSTLQRLRRGLLVAGGLLAAILMAGSAAAQTAPEQASEAAAPDWDLRDGNGFLMAVVVYNPGLIIGVRCRAWDLDAFISGLPASGDEWTRSLEMKMDEDDFAPSTWAVTTEPGTVFSLLPGRFARGLREGGPLQVRAQGPDGRRMRYVMELPSSPAAIDQVLTKCRKPLVDPQDAVLEAAGPITTSPGPRDWARQPRPRYPDEGLGVTRGLATLSCVAAPTGQLSDCVIESEYPRDRGFGRASLQSVGRALVEPRPEESPALVVFTVRFRMAGYGIDGEPEH